jgi:hypothetical protein
MVVGPTSMARAADPEVNFKIEMGWSETKYIFSLNKEAAIRLREALNRADPKLIGDAIGNALAVAIPDVRIKIGIKILTMLVTNNVEAFRRALNKEGAIGPNGITITLTASGWLPMLLSGSFSGNLPLLDVANIAINPRSWSIAPRE